MKIVEIYKTIQGEGKYAGTPSLFVRTTGCNLRCSWRNRDGSVTRCDTPYASFRPEFLREITAQEIYQESTKSPLTHVVITGGEPTLQKDLEQTVQELRERNLRVTIETNGTLFKPGIVGAFLSISPKLSSSYAQTETRDSEQHRRNNEFEEACARYIEETRDYQFKFVFNEPADLEEILEIQRKLKIPNEKIYLMPQGINQMQFADRNQAIVSACMKHGFNYSPRLHITLWGNARGN